MIIDSITTFPVYVTHVRAFIQSAISATHNNPHFLDGAFDTLARALFSLQFDHNAPYRQFCQSRKITPRNVTHWSYIPAMPAAGFKEFELTCLPLIQRTRVFHSSGTTEQRPSRHFHNADSLALYEVSLLPWFATHLLSGGDEFHCVFLTPPPMGAPQSSLVHMFETIRREFASPDSRFTGVVGSDGVWAIDLTSTLAALRDAIAEDRPVMLLGTAFGYVHLLDGVREIGTSLRLPSGSRVMETGGYKGRSRALPKPELHGLITGLLGIPAANIVCEYGMSELSSQAYDSAAGNLHSKASRAFHFPPWARTQIVSPETGGEVGEGETGLIRIFDLANVQSVMAIQTEDLGVRHGRGFELLGRAALAEPRGCSLQSI